MRLRRAVLAIVLCTVAGVGFSQTTVTLDATSGTGTVATNQATGAGLTLDLGFYAEYLVLAGGGGGGGSANDGTAWGGGGGGAGGLRTGTTQLVSGTSYTVQVGGGGAGGQMTSTQANQQGSNGASSIFGSVTAAGGGGGGRYKQQGNAGGSGGGGGGRASTAGGAGNTPSTTPSQGNAGGNARGGDDSGRSGGGGGGGAGGAGGNGAPTSSTAGNGGIGSVSTITGSSVTYAGGGGGGAIDTNDGAGETAGTGGTGGGGNGSTSGNATAGTDGLGGGGGGVGNNGAGGRGGSGIVIARYQGASLGAIGGTVTSGSGSAAGYTLHTFTTSGTTTGTSALNLTGVDMNARLATTLTGTISGTGSLTFAGPGRLTLSASNSFTGDTRISSGTLAIGDANALRSSTLDMNGSDSGAITFSQASTIGGLKGSRDVANGGNTLTIGGNDSSTTYSGVLSGSGGLTKQGTGTLTLTGSNTYTGLTTVSSGTLAIGSGGTTGRIAGDIANSGAVVFNRSNAVTYAGSISGTGSLIKSGAGTLTLTGSNTYTGLTTVSSGTLAIGSGGTTGAIAGDIANSGAVVFNRSNAVTYAGSISGTGSLTKSGIGTLTLSGSSSFTGDTRIMAGTLAVGNANALAGSTLDMNSSDSGAITFSQASNLGGLTGSRNLANGGNSLTIGGNNASTTYSGNLSGAGGLTKNGTGSLTLSASNSFTGDTRIASGTLAVLNIAALRYSILDMNASDSGAITFARTSQLGGLKGSRNLDNGGSTLVINSDTSTTYSGVLSGAGGLTKVLSQKLTLSGNNTYTGKTFVAGGTLAIGDGGTSGSLAGDVIFSYKADIEFNRSDASTYAGGISRTGNLTKHGAGTLTLTGSNSFKGDTTVSAGTLVLGSGNALGPNAAVTVASGATLQVTSTTPIRIGYLDSQGTVTGSNNLTATLTVTRSGNIGGLADGTDSQGTFAAGIAKLGTGTSTVNTPNTYTGLTWVREGTLAIGTANAFAAASSITVDAGATLSNTAGGQPIAVKDIDVNGTIVSTGGLLTSSGLFSGTGTITGNVLSTGTFAGSQSITGDVEVRSLHAPGSSAGIQTVTGNLSYTTSPSFQWELFGNTTSNSGTTQFDQLIVGGDLTFATATPFSLLFDGLGSTVDWTDSFWTTSQQWEVWDVTGTTTGFGSLSLTTSNWADGNGGLFDTLLPGSSFSLSLGANGKDVMLTYNISSGVPEIDPAGLGSVAALVAGSAGLFERRRRRRPAA